MDGAFEPVDEERSDGSAPGVVVRKGEEQVAVHIRPESDALFVLVQEGAVHLIDRVRCRVRHDVKLTPESGRKWVEPTQTHRARIDP